MSSAFRKIVLLKAPQAFEVPSPQSTSDFTELCYLAAVVEPHVDSVAIPVHFYSPRALSLLEEYYRRHRPDLVGISAMTGAYGRAVELAKMAKRHGAFVVMGGYHPSALPDDVLSVPEVDAVVIGEGEMTFLELVQRGPSRDVAGLAFRENGSVVITAPRPTIRDLDALPQPLRRIRPERFGEAGDDYTFDTVYTSRGCPWKCTFCANDLVNKQWRARSPENVIEELASLHNPRKRRLIKIWDANFMTNIKRVERICDLMLENGLTNFKIWTETRVEDIVRAEGIMAKLYAVGLRNLSLGIESPNEETLRIMNKANRNDTVEQAVRILNEHRIKSQGYLIIGNYNETEEDTRRYPEYAEKIGLTHFILMVMTPYPGTEIHRQYEEQGLIASKDWDRYNNFTPVVRTRHMSFEKVQEMYLYCWGRFFGRALARRCRESYDLVGNALIVLVPLGVLISLDRTLSPQDVRNRMFDFLRYAAGRSFLVRYPPPSGRRTMRRRRRAGNKSTEVLPSPPWLLRWADHLGARFQGDDGRCVDFHMTLIGPAVHHSVDVSDGARPIRGPTIRIRDVHRLSETIGIERMTTLSSRLYEMSMHSRGVLPTAWTLLRDRDLRSAAFPMGLLLLRVWLGGHLAVVRDVFRGRRRPDRRARSSRPPPSA